MEYYKCSNCMHEDIRPFPICPSCGTLISNYKAMKMRDRAFWVFPILFIGGLVVILVFSAIGLDFVEKTEFIVSWILGSIFMVPITRFVLWIFYKW